MALFGVLNDKYVCGYGHILYQLISAVILSSVRARLSLLIALSVTPRVARDRGLTGFIHRCNKRFFTFFYSGHVFYVF